MPAVGSQRWYAASIFKASQCFKCFGLFDFKTWHKPIELLPCKLTHFLTWTWPAESAFYFHAFIQEYKAIISHRSTFTQSQYKARRQLLYRLAWKLRKYLDCFARSSGSVSFEMRRFMFPIINSIAAVSVFLFMSVGTEMEFISILQLPDETVHKLTADFSQEYLRSHSCGDA